MSKKINNKEYYSKEEIGNQYDNSFAFILTVVKQEFGANDNDLASFIGNCGYNNTQTIRDNASDDDLLCIKSALDYYDKHY